METYIATVEYYDEVDGKKMRDTVLMRANSYTEAVTQIEAAFGNDIEKIISLAFVATEHVIHLGDGEFIDQIVNTIMEANAI